MAEWGKSHSPTVDKKEKFDTSSSILEDRFGKRVCHRKEKFDTRLPGLCHHINCNKNRATNYCAVSVWCELCLTSASSWQPHQNWPAVTTTLIRVLRQRQRSQQRDARVTEKLCSGARADDISFSVTHEHNHQLASIVRVSLVVW